MRAEDLDLHELLQLDPDTGVVRFAGQRALLMDAVAMGVLRKYLFENFGIAATRVILTQFGFAHGWRLAEAMQAEISWRDTEELRRAGVRLLVLKGFFRADIRADPLDGSGLSISSSYEAEQHLLHAGRSEEAVCWTTCGMLSGFTSQIAGEEVFVLEDQCIARGHAVCHLMGRNRVGWEHAPHIDVLHYDPTRLRECLDVSLQRVTDDLRAAEQRVQAQKRILAVAQVPDAPLGIVTKSTAMRQVVDLARRVARVDSTVLITGESGVGKERIARLVHNESGRSNGPFIAVNCGAITESLLESELFGHARGAFTGANQDRPGLFEAANGGTLLLDEVGEVSPGMQVKLLRVLQEREVRRVGENKNRRIDVRVVAATNRDLKHGVDGGNFRQDLYYRLKVVELHVPALRERRDDVLPLARVFLAAASEWMKRPLCRLNADSADLLLRYNWPGNVRELENTMERAVALARSNQVEAVDLPPEIRQVVSSAVAITGPVRPLEEIERDYILAALEANAGNQTRTAAQLQIGQATLYRKLRAFRLAREGGSSERGD